MSSEGENAKNTSLEQDEKATADTTDTSQDSHDANIKSEKKTNDDGDSKSKEKSPVTEKTNDKENDAKAKTEKSSENDSKNDVDGKASSKKSANKNDTKTDDDSEEDEEDVSDKETDSKKDPPAKDKKKNQKVNDDVKDAKTEIPDGKGTRLGEIPRIDASISRFKTEDLKLLHKVLFKIPGKNNEIKKNIKQFNGFEFTKDSKEYKEKVTTTGKLEVKQLKIICEMLDLEKNGKKEEIAERICEFLIEPKDSGKGAGGGRPKRTAAVRANNRGYSSHDDSYSSDDQKKSRSRRGKGKRANLKDESSSESDEDFDPGEAAVPRVTPRKRSVRKKPQDSEDEASDLEESPEESLDSDFTDDEPKAKRKKGSSVKVSNNKSKKASPKTRGRKPAAKKKPEPAKKAAGKKKVKDESEEEEEESEGSSSENEPLVKKSKSPQPPTDEEIKSYVKEILEGANLEEITMKTVCKQVYAHYPDFDLAHKKDFIKTTVKSLIST